MQRELCHNDKIIHLAYLLFISILVIVLYHSAFKAQFWDVISDDKKNLINNACIQDFTIKNLICISTHRFIDNYCPVLMFSYMLIFLVHGLDPLPFHIANLLWFILDGYLIFYLVRVLSNNYKKAFLASILFLIHPINTNVMYISEMKTYMALSFILLSLLAYIKFRKENNKFWRITVVIAFIAGLLTKAVAFTIPLFFILYDVLFTESKVWVSIKRNIVLFLFGSLIALGYGISIPGMGDIGTNITKHVMNAVINTAMMFRYPINIIFPFNISPYYMPVIPSFLEFFISLIFLILITVYLFHYNLRYYMFWWLWYIVNFLPGSGLFNVPAEVQGQGLNYYLSIPMIGLTIIISQILIGFYEDLKQNTIGKGIFFIFTFLIIISLCVITFNIAPYYKNEITIIKYMSERYPEDRVFILTESALLAKKGFQEQAMSIINKHIASNTKDADAYTLYGAGIVSYIANKRKEAIKLINMALERPAKPFSQTYPNLMDQFLWIQMFSEYQSPVSLLCKLYTEDGDYSNAMKYCNH